MESFHKISLGLMLSDLLIDATIEDLICMLVRPMFGIVFLEVSSVFPSRRDGNRMPFKAGLVGVDSYIYSTQKHLLLERTNRVIYNLIKVYK